MPGLSIPSRVLWDDSIFRLIPRYFANSNVPLLITSRPAIILDGGSGEDDNSLQTVMNGYVRVFRDTNYVQDSLPYIQLDFASEPTFTYSQTIRDKLRHDFYLIHQSSELDSSSGLMVDSYYLQISRTSSLHLSPVLVDPVYLIPRPEYINYFIPLSGGNPDYALFPIAIGVTSKPRVILPEDTDAYESSVKIYDALSTVTPLEYGEVEVGDGKFLFSGGESMYDDTKPLFVVSYGPMGLNEPVPQWAVVVRVYLRTPYGNVYFVQNDIPPSERTVEDFTPYLYPRLEPYPYSFPYQNYIVERSWAEAPKRNGSANAVVSQVTIPSQQSYRRGLFIYVRDLSVFPAGISDDIPCEIVVEHILGETVRPVVVSVISASKKYRYSTFNELGTIEFKARLGSPEETPDSVREFFDKLYVIEGSVREEYGYDFRFSSRERVLFPNTLTMKIRVDVEDSFQRAIDIIDGVRFYGKDGELLFKGDLETSAGEVRVSYTDSDETISLTFHNGILKVLDQKLLTPDGKFDTAQLRKWFNFDVLGVDAFRLFEEVDGHPKFRGPYTSGNPPAFFTLRFWLSHFARIFGLSTDNIPEKLIIPDMKLKVLVFRAFRTGVRPLDNNPVSDQLYEEEVIEEVDLMRMVISLHKVMGSTDGDTFSSTVGEALNRVLSFFDLRIFVYGDGSFTLVSFYVPDERFLGEVNMLESYTERVLSSRERAFAYVFPLFRPIEPSDFINGGTLPHDWQNWQLDLAHELTTPQLYFHRKWSLYGEARYVEKVEPRFWNYFRADRLRDEGFRVEGSFLHIPEVYDYALNYLPQNSPGGNPVSVLVRVYGCYFGSSLSVNWNNNPPTFLYQNHIPNEHPLATVSYSGIEAFYGVPASYLVAKSLHYNSEMLGRISRHALFYLRKEKDQDGLPVEKPAVMTPFPLGAGWLTSSSHQPRRAWYIERDSPARWLFGSPNGSVFQGMEDYMGIVYKVIYKGVEYLLSEFEAKGIWEQVSRNVLGVEGEVFGVYDRIGTRVEWRGRSYLLIRLVPHRDIGTTEVTMRRLYDIN